MVVEEGRGTYKETFVPIVWLGCLSDPSWQDPWSISSMAPPTRRSTC